MTIGIVSQPGDDPNAFEFITPDDTALKTGEFVTYTANVDGAIETIYARVTDRERERGFPDRFLADPDVAPATVASKLGVPNEEVDLYRLTATIIGYYDEALAGFTNPRILPPPGTDLELAPDDDLARFLPAIDPDSDAGRARIGDLLHRADGAVPIDIPIDNYTATHLAILASTGSGKSYTAAVLAEEMMQPDSRAAMLIADPHGEYHTLAEIEGDDRYTEDRYSPDVRTWRPDEVRVRISELTFSDLQATLDNISDRQEHVLYEAWNSLQGENFISVEQLKNACHDEAGDEYRSSAVALEWRLDKALGRRGLFDESQELPLTELFQPGRCSVLQMDTMPLSDQQMVLSVLLRKLYRERVAATRDRESEVEFPVFVLLEESHRFAPDDGDARSLPILRTILSEGRKFGLGVGIISQRPSKIDDDVLSQCGTQVIMQIQNPNDQDAIRRSVESVGQDVLQELPGLTPGQAVISGDSVNTPFLSRIRSRHTTHGAESLATTQEWRAEWVDSDREPDGVIPPNRTEHRNEDRDELL